MNYQKERDEFIAAATREGIPLSALARLLRDAQTYKRLAERECNGDDWNTGALVACPNAKGELASGAFHVNRYCQHCGSLKADQCHGRVSRSSLRMERIETRWACKKPPEGLPAGFHLRWSGDPRGAVARILCPSGASNGWGDGLAVPTRY